MASTTNPTVTLCHWVCSTRYEDLPAEVCSEVAARLQSLLGHYGTRSQFIASVGAPWARRWAPACCSAWMPSRWSIR